MNYPRIALSALLVALLSACGGPNQGPQTHQYLQQATGIVAQMNGELAKISTSNAPDLPHLTGERTQEQADILTTFSKELTAYYTSVGKAVNQALPICDDAQSKTHALNTAGVDESATSLADRYTGLLDRRQQLAVDMESLIVSEQSRLKKGVVPQFSVRVIQAGIATLLSPTGSASSIEELKPTDQEKKEMDDQGRALLKVIADFRSDDAGTATARNDLMNSLKAKYSGLDWGFLAGNPSS